MRPASHYTKMFPAIISERLRWFFCFQAIWFLPSVCPCLWACCWALWSTFCWPGRPGAGLRPGSPGAPKRSLALHEQTTPWAIRWASTEALFWASTGSPLWSRWGLWGANQEQRHPPSARCPRRAGLAWIWGKTRKCTCLRTRQLHLIQRPSWQTRGIPSGWAATDLKDSCRRRRPLLHTTVSSMPLKRLALETIEQELRRKFWESRWTFQICTGL